MSTLSEAAILNGDKMPANGAEQRHADGDTDADGGGNLQNDNGPTAVTIKQQKQHKKRSLKKQHKRECN